VRLKIGRTYRIGSTGRRGTAIGYARDRREGRLVRVRADDKLGGRYEELYRPDGTWPFNALGNFDLKPL